MCPLTTVAQESPQCGCDVSMEHSDQTGHDQDRVSQWEGREKRCDPLISSKVGNVLDSMTLASHCTFVYLHVTYFAAACMTFTFVLHKASLISVLQVMHFYPPFSFF